MNFFELFALGAESHVRAHLEPNVITDALEKKLMVARDDHARSFFKPDRPDYRRNDVQLAYTFHYAPKHATMWYQFARNSPTSICGLRFNSIGTGPGSEVFGAVEAHRPPPGSIVQVYCLDVEPAWEQIFNEVANVYFAQTGVQIIRSNVALENLTAGVPTLGSLVLSEIGREMNIHTFLDQVKRAVSPSQGWFLDLPKFTARSNGQSIEYGMPETLGFDRWPNYVPRLNLAVTEKCNEDMKSVVCRCRKTLDKEPVMLFYPWIFR